MSDTKLRPGMRWRPSPEQEAYYSDVATRPPTPGEILAGAVLEAEGRMPEKNATCSKCALLDRADRLPCVDPVTGEHIYAGRCNRPDHGSYIMWDDDPLVCKGFKK